MSYGIKIKNGNNEIQVDGVYKNFSLHTSGTWSVTGGGYGWYDFSKTGPNNPPILAIQLPTTYCISTQYKQDSNGCYYSTRVYTDNDATIPYIVFTETGANEIPSGSYGLAVYNANGDLVFHNHQKWCRIVSVTTFLNPLTADCGVGEGEYADISVEDADNNYFILRPFCAYHWYSGGPEYMTYVYQPQMKKLDAITVRVGTVETFYYYEEQTACYSSEYLTLIEVNVG